MRMIATIQLLVEAGSEVEAADGVAEAMRPLLRRYQDYSPYESCILDWRYAAYDPNWARNAALADGPHEGSSDGFEFDL